ncbi:MAG: hypothetical protein R6X02_26695 [Enhygromyxa sp.]
MGRGHHRVPCIFPFASWTKLVIAAAEARHGQDRVKWQTTKKHLEVLLRRLKETGTRRNGRLGKEETWIAAAKREHAEFPFGGILVRSTTSAEPYVVAADRLHEQTKTCWHCAPVPVLRKSAELAALLAPLLRSATQIRFVDPYFDAAVPEFRDPMIAYLEAAQCRRTVGDLRVEFHFAVKSGDRKMAASRILTIEKELGPRLDRRVKGSAYAWNLASNKNKMHNRYVLTEVGGIAASCGLDESNIPNTNQTDDFTVLSDAQYRDRWREFSPGGKVHRIIESRDFRGTR